MSLTHRLRRTGKEEINTGFGQNTSDYGGRFVNKEGKANIEKRGISFLERTSWYHSFLAINRWKFFSVIIGFYFIINLCFALLYWSIGISHLNGIIPSTPLHDFAEAFFFSCQTFTTVGYGRINPVGFITSGIASVEALTGLLSLALATGLLYGRFSKPRAFLKFSHNAVIAPFHEGKALMMRVAPFKNTTLTEAMATVTLAMSVEEDGRYRNEFYPLKLEYNTVNALTLSWTLVHPITADSPLHGLTEKDFANTTGEVMIFLKAFDDMFSTSVVARTSYTFKEIVWGAKFQPMFHRSLNGDRTILELHKLNSYIKA